MALPVYPYYPRSFTVLVIVAMGVLILPLASGLISTVHLLQGVIDAQRQFTRDSLTITRDIRQIVEGLSQWQRAAGQYHLLRDAELATSVRDSYSELHARLIGLDDLLPAPVPRAALQAVIAQSARLNRRLKPGNFLDSQAFNALKPDFTALHTEAEALQTRGDDYVQLQLHVLEAEVQTTRQRLIVLTVALIPLTLLLAGVFSWMINRPIRQLKDAIQQLARGDLRALPNIGGPQDIVELRHEIDWLRQRLGEIEEQKTQFLRHVSHELKTPLASLREVVGLMLERLTGPMTDRQQSIVQIMDHSSRELQRRIEDLIRYSGMMHEVGTATITLLHLASVLDTVVARHRLAIEARKLKIIPQLEALGVYADREQMETVLDNLVSNAIKFSPDGGSILIHSSNFSKGYRLQVCDQGPGIPLMERTRIFEAFVQGAQQPDNAVRGSGLGLSIVREALRRMDGTATVIDLPSWSVCLNLEWPIPIRIRPEPNHAASS